MLIHEKDGNCLRPSPFSKWQWMVTHLLQPPCASPKWDTVASVPKPIHTVGSISQHHWLPQPPQKYGTVSDMLASLPTTTKLLKFLYPGKTDRTHYGFGSSHNLSSKEMHWIWFPYGRGLVNATHKLHFVRSADNLMIKQSADKLTPLCPPSILVPYTYHQHLSPHWIDVHDSVPKAIPRFPN